MKKRTAACKKYLFHILCIFSALLFSGGCAVSGEPITRTGFYFDTIIQVTIYDAAKEYCLTECMSLAEKYEKMLSQTIEGSDIWKINHSGGRPVQVSAETVLLLKTALSYSEMTDGLIDPTIETVSSLWDFHADQDLLSENEPENKADRLPESQELEEALKHVDYHNLLIEGNTVTLSDPESRISLGFLAKGFIADQLKEYLLSQKIESAIINLGGNLLAVGKRPDGTPFQFGVQMPFDAQGSVITVLSVADRSAVSSGVYERYFYQDGMLYHHILNPGTGYPVQNGLLGVTVLTDSSMMGDALSTACFILGPDKGMQLIESLENTDAVFITDDYALHYSSGLSDAK